MAGTAASTERVFTVAGNGIEFRTRLSAAWQARPFVEAVVHPFLAHYGPRAQHRRLPKLSREGLRLVKVDGVPMRLDEPLAAVTDVLPPGAQRVDLLFGEEAPRELRFEVSCGETSVRVTLDRRWLARSFADSVVVPFLSVYNKRQNSPTQPAELSAALVDGVKVAAGAECTAVASKPVLEVVGARPSHVELVFGRQAEASRSRLSNFRHRIAHMSAGEYRAAKELSWGHKELTSEDGTLIANEFARAAPLKTLKYLYLYNNDLRDEGVAALARVLSRS